MRLPLNRSPEHPGNPDCPAPAAPRPGKTPRRPVRGGATDVLVLTLILVAVVVMVGIGNATAGVLGAASAFIVAVFGAWWGYRNGGAP